VIAYGNDDDDDDETMFNQGHPIAVLSRTLAKLELQKYIQHNTNRYKITINIQYANININHIEGKITKT
jgi:hypothetical protein